MTNEECAYELFGVLSLLQGALEANKRALKNNPTDEQVAFAVKYYSRKVMALNTAITYFSSNQMQA